MSSRPYNKPVPLKNIAVLLNHVRMLSSDVKTYCRSRTKKNKKIFNYFINRTYSFACYLQCKCHNISQEISMVSYSDSHQGNYRVYNHNLLYSPLHLRLPDSRKLYKQAEDCTLYHPEKRRKILAVSINFVKSNFQLTRKKYSNIDFFFKNFLIKNMKELVEQVSKIGVRGLKS